MRTNHIQHHNHKANLNTLAAELREELFGDCDIFEFGAYAFYAGLLAVMASVAIYMAAVYLI